MTALAASPATAAGQTKSMQYNQPQSSRQDCQAKPGQKKSKESDGSTGSITKKLDNCGGVLSPPDVNDKGLVKPAPDTGAMPVIKPGQVPQQAPKE